MTNPTLFELLILLVLATYRLTIMFNAEAGPGDVFGRLRTRMGVEFDEFSKPFGTNWLSEGVLCFYCLSVWVGFGVAGLIVLAWLAGRVEIAIIVLLPFALSGGAVYLKKAAG